VNKRLLIVDDLDANRYLLRVQLEGLGYEVEEASGGDDALQRAHLHPPDALITDLLMPGMDGFSLCRAWHDAPSLAPIPFVVYTATFTDERDRQLARDLGADAFVLKPAAPEALAETLRSVIEETRPETDSTPASRDDADVLERYAARLKSKLDERLARIDAEQVAAKELIEKHARLLDQLPLAILTLDATGRVEDWNLAAQRLLGEELAERHVGTFIAADQRREVEAQLAAARSSQPVGITSVRLLRGDRELSVEMNVGLVGDEGELLVSFRDRTDELRAADGLRRLDAHVAQVERLATVGMLAAGIAHEINNPLTHVMLSLEEVADQLPKVASGAVDAAALATIVVETTQSALRIRQISRGLSSFSRVEDEKPGLVRVADAVEAAHTMAQSEIRSRARFTVDHRTNAAVRFTPGRMEQVFLNLLINAAHAIEDDDPERNEIRVCSWSEGSLVYITVRDTGSGIPPDVRARIFEPLYSTKSYGKGSGLGLAISKSIVEKYGGRISVDSVVGEFTEFTIVLPAALEEQNSPAGTVTRASGRPRVLLVGSAAGMGLDLSSIASNEIEVQEVGSVDDAKAVISVGSAFGAVVCAAQLSDDGGAVALHRWLADNRPTTAARMVFITGDAAGELSGSYAATVPNPILELPASADQLLGSVLEVYQPTTD